MIPISSVSRRRLWFMRFAAMIFIPIFILGGIEIGLHLAGYGYDTSFFRRIKIEGHDFYVPNKEFSYRFFPPAIAQKTPPFRFAAEGKASQALAEFRAVLQLDPTNGLARQQIEVIERR